MHAPLLRSKTAPSCVAKRLESAGHDKGVRLHAGHSVRHGWCITCHGVFGADEGQAEICPERKRRYAILKQNLGKWRPRFLLCYMAPSNGHTDQPRKIHAFAAVSGPGLFAATTLPLKNGNLLTRPAVLRQQPVRQRRGAPLVKRVMRTCGMLGDFPARQTSARGRKSLGRCVCILFP